MDQQSGKALGARCPKLQLGRRHGSWYVRLELPVGADGRRRRIRRGGFVTRKAAEEALEQLGSARGSENAAIRQGLISDNPASRVELPVARRPRAMVWTAARVEHWQRTGARPPVAVWTAAQTAEFLHAIREHRLYAVFHLIALRGLRRGEAAGLRWCDVDLDQRVAVISQQIQQHQGYLTACPPKTATSARVIALDRTTVTAMREHRGQQQRELQQAGADYRDSGYVFTAPNGDPLAPERLTRLFQGLVAEHRPPPIRLHDLRHGAATLALAAGVELKVVQDMLGHSSIVLTADTYTSVLPEVAHRAAEKTAKHVLKAGRLVPGTNRVRRRDTGRRKRRRGKARAAPTRASLAHPARQLGRPQRC